MKNAQENERCGKVNAKVIVVMLVLAGSALLALKGSLASLSNGEKLSHRVITRREQANIAKKDACLKKLSKNGFALNVNNKQVKVMKMKEDGFLEKTHFNTAEDSLVSPSTKVRNTILMDQDGDVNSPKLLVTMEDDTKLVADLNTCTTLIVFMPRHATGDAPSKWKGDDVDKAGALQVGEDKWNTDKMCWKDNQYNGERMMRNIWDNVVMYSDGAMSPAWCANKCSGYKYYGLQFRRECFCGTKLRYKLSTHRSDCDCICVGDGWRYCGCANRMRIFTNSQYQSKCLKFPRHYSRYMNGQDSIGFFQEGCTISANIFRWNGRSHDWIKAYVGHFVKDWNQFFITLSNGEGQWQGFAKRSSSSEISLISWVTGSWAGRTFHAYT